MNSAAEHADTNIVIHLPAGHYCLGSSLPTPYYYNGTSAKLLGAGAAETIIDGGNADSTSCPASSGTLLPIQSYGGNLTIEDVTLRGAASSTQGGAISVFNIALTVSRVFFDHNSALAGGAIYNGDSLAVDHCSFVGNTATQQGGAINGSVTVSNSTFANNAALADGGALFGSGSLTNVTVVSNVAGTDTSVEKSLGGGVSGAFMLHNTLLAFNTDKSATSNAAPDCAGAVSAGGNLVRDRSNCGLLALLGDQFGTAATPIDPLVGGLSLASAGPPFLVLRPASPAIDAANNDTCPADDQRGNPRSVDGNFDGKAVCDIGAVEMSYANVALAIEAKPASAQVGDAISITVTAQNAVGAATAHGVSLHIELPTGFAIESAPICTSNGQGGVDNTVVDCALGDLAAAASASVTVGGTPKVSGTLSLIATLGLNDTNWSTTASSVSVSIPVEAGVAPSATPTKNPSTKPTASAIAATPSPIPASNGCQAVGDADIFLCALAAAIALRRKNLSRS